MCSCELLAVIAPHGIYVKSAPLSELACPWERRIQPCAFSEFRNRPANKRPKITSRVTSARPNGATGIAHWGGRSSIPETAAIESIGRGVLACAGHDGFACRYNPDRFRHPRPQMIEPKMIELNAGTRPGGLPYLRPECPPTEVCLAPSGSRRAHGLVFYPTG
jgi:hypothetical protein